MLKVEEYIKEKKKFLKLKEDSTNVYYLKTKLEKMIEDYQEHVLHMKCLVFAIVGILTIIFSAFFIDMPIELKYIFNISGIGLGVAIIIFSFFCFLSWLENKTEYVSFLKKENISNLFNIDIIRHEFKDKSKLSEELHNAFDIQKEKINSFQKNISKEDIEEFINIKSNITEEDIEHVEYLTEQLLEKIKTDYDSRKKAIKNTLNEIRNLEEITSVIINQ